MEQSKHRFKSIHVTTNRACNLRCEWCYAQGEKFSKSEDMSAETLQAVSKFCDSANINSVILIGGEPTVYPLIEDALNLFSKKSITLVTNGVLLSSNEVCKDYIDRGVSRFSVSIKAENREKYLNLTKRDCFDRVLKAIENLSKNNAKYSVSYVITQDNIRDIPEMVRVTQNAGAENYFFSVCRNFNLNGISDKDFVNANNPFIIAREFEKLLPWLKQNIKNFSYAINEPLCSYSKDFLDENIKDFYYPCYLHNNTSITFDPHGYLIPCNTIHQIKVGKLGDDFDDIDSYLAFEETDKYKDIYKKLRGLPDERCNDCDVVSMCRGRCVCNWTNYTFDELKNDVFLASK